MKVTFNELDLDGALIHLKRMNEDMKPNIFATRESIEQVEEGDQLAPKFDQVGVIPCITMHAETKEVLMFAFMNPEALTLTIETGLAHYWSRSRQKLWKKGESSGVKEASCHVGYRSCFYREVPVGKSDGPVSLRFIEDEKSFDPKAVYGDTPNPTQL